MIELLGRMPRNFTSQGTRCKEFFNNNGELKAMKKNMNPHWPLSAVLKEKYSFSAETSAGVSAFIGGLLRFVPAQRWTAAQALEQPYASTDRRFMQEVVIRYPEEPQSPEAANG